MTQQMAVRAILALSTRLSAHVDKSSDSYALKGGDREMPLPTRSQHIPCFAVLAVLLLGCGASQEVIIWHDREMTSTGETFMVTDGSIVMFTDLVTSRSTSELQFYVRRTDTTVLPFWRVTDVTVTRPEPTFAARLIGTVGGTCVGLALGMFLGTDAGLGPKRHAEYVPPALYTAAAGGLAGAILGGFAGYYCADYWSSETIHLDPAIPSQRDSLQIYAEHAE